MADNSEVWFDDTPVLAEMEADERLSRLEESGEVAPADEGQKGISALLGFEKKAYDHAQHAFGFIPPRELDSADPVAIRHAGNMSPDESLKNARIIVSLDRMMVYNYPGRGGRLVLFDFYAQNQLALDQVEHVHVNQVYRAQEEELVGSIGFPVFIGLGVGDNGCAFKCFTVNVRNNQDQALLDFLDSEVAKTGLKLAATAQPAIAPLANMAVGFTKMIAKRNQNVPVQDFFMGLDFGQSQTGARLREGSYIAVQTDELWNWSDWVYDPNSGRIVRADDPTKTIPYNYIVFGVRRYQEE